MNTLNLDIVTPNGSVYKREDVELVVLQTTAGEMGIMSGHILHLRLQYTYFYFPIFYYSFINYSYFFKKNTIIYKTVIITLMTEFIIKNYKNTLF